MLARKILCYVLVVACGTLAFAGSAGAGMVATGSLTLSCYDLASGSSPGGCTAQNYAVPGDYTYTETFSAPTGSTAIAGSNIYDGNTNTNTGSAGFIDDYLFTISAASADAVTATISNGSAFDIGNLFVTLYSLSANPGGLVLTQPAGTVYYGDVSTVGGATSVILNNVMLPDGSYVLQVSGTSSGTYGGSYTGSLELTPVPLPASFPLLLAGLLGIAGVMLQRSRKL